MWGEFRPDFFVMIRTYYTNTDYISLTELNLSKIPLQRKEKIDKLIKEEDKKQCLAAGLFIDKFFPGKEIKTEKYGKPYVVNGMEFNIAHSHNYVIFCVSSGQPVGCDIEKLKVLNYEKTGKFVFHKNEINALKNSENQQELFFDFWTKKESFIKCLGMGFHFKTKKIDLTESKHYVTYQNRKFRFKDYMLEDCKIMICSPETDFANSIEEIRFN